MRRLIAVLAAVAAVPLLTLSASAQSSGSSALVADLRAKCSSEISAGVAYSVQKGESRADAERELAEVLNEMVGPEGDEKTMQYVVDHASEIGENVPAANNFFRCIGGARLAQLRNGNRPVGQAVAAAPPRSTAPATSGPLVTRTSAASEICDEKGKDLQVQSRSWPETGNARALKLGRMQKALFQGDCAGVPAAAAWIAGADRMIAGAGGTTGAAPGGATSSGGGYTAVYDNKGNLVSSTGSPSGRSTVVASSGGSGTGSAGSRGQSMGPSSGKDPSPDANRCIQIVEDNRENVCGTQDGHSVRIANKCTEKVFMQLCIYNPAESKWRCGSGSGTKAADVLSRACRSDGRYLYAGCSESAWRNSNGGNCGGDPNKQGY